MLLLGPEIVNIQPLTPTVVAAVFHFKSLSFALAEGEYHRSRSQDDGGLSK
jgi:hypothetical protein